MRRGHHGTSMNGVERSPARKARDRRRRQAQDERAARKSGPVTIKKIEEPRNPEGVRMPSADHDATQSTHNGASGSAENDAPRETCLIVCITTDDEGRAYWCESCPELARAIPPGEGKPDA